VVKNIMGKLINITKQTPPSISTLLEIDERLMVIEREVVGVTLEESLANGDFRGTHKRRLTHLVNSVNKIKEECRDGRDTCPAVTSIS